MRYRIKRMVSKEKTRERIFLVACVMIYFLFFVISAVYEDHIFPEWVYQTYKKLPK